MPKHGISFWCMFQEGAFGHGKGLLVGPLASGEAPKAFRFDTEKVRIRRHGRSVILEPVADNWDWLDALAGPVDEDFAAAAAEKPKEQERPALDVFE